MFPKIIVPLNSQSIFLINYIMCSGLYDINFIQWGKINVSYWSARKFVFLIRQMFSMSKNAGWVYKTIVKLVVKKKKKKKQSL